jgi:hypothetical protein
MWRGKHPITGNVATTTFFTPRRLIRCRSAASWLTSPSVKAGSPYHVKKCKKYKLKGYIFIVKNTCKTLFIQGKNYSHPWNLFWLQNRMNSH